MSRLGGKGKMRNTNDLFGRLFLRYLSQFLCFREVPVLGRLLHWVSHQLLPAETHIWVPVREGVGKGLWLKLNPRTGRDYYEGNCEPLVQEVLQKYLQQKMVFYDVGANIGFFTLIAGRLVGQEGRVFAFEPEREVVERLQKHVERNGFSNVSVIQAAVWSTTGSVTFIRSDPRCSPDRGLGRVALSVNTGDGIAIPSIALDDFIQRAPPPHLIKCDVEGAEVEVFQGAQKLLAQYKPIVVCEIHSDGNLELLQQLFSGLAYKLSLLNSHHLLALPS